MTARFSLVVAVLLPLFATAGASEVLADAYKVDKTHSFITFRIKHFGASYCYGRFNQVKGSFDFDPADLETLSMEVEAKTKSLDTNDSKRDKHLKSPDFFNAKEFPKMTFKSTSVKRIEGNLFVMTGDLTLLGTTKSITVQLEYVGSGKGMGDSYLTGFLTTFKIKRSDFGMDFMVGKALSDEVEITVAIEGARQ